MSFRIYWLVMMIATIPFCSTSSQEPNVPKPMFKLGVKANFDGDRMRILEVEQESPATNLHNEDRPRAKLNPDDVIEEVDGVPIKSHADLIRVLNLSPDGYVQLKVRDRSTGTIGLWHTGLKPTATSAYELLRDTYQRSVARDEVPRTELVLVGIKPGQGFVMSNLFSVLNPVFAKNDTANADERFRRLVVGVAEVERFATANPEIDVFSAESFRQCDEVLRSTFGQINTLVDEEQKLLAQTKAYQEIEATLRRQIDLAAEKLGKPHVQESNMPRLVPFKPKPLIDGATVELLLAAEKTLRLMREGHKVRPVDQAGQTFLDRSVAWTPLPADQAQAYGRYYYRLSYLEDGNVRLTPFDENRSVLINQVPPSGEIVFK